MQGCYGRLDTDRDERESPDVKLKTEYDAEFRLFEKGMIHGPEEHK